jgi:hypothetical protein
VIACRDGPPCENICGEIQAHVDVAVHLVRETCRPQRDARSTIMFKGSYRSTRARAPAACH